MKLSLKCRENCSVYFSGILKNIRCRIAKLLLYVYIFCILINYRVLKSVFEKRLIGKNHISCLVNL